MGMQGPCTTAGESDISWYEYGVRRSGERIYASDYHSDQDSRQYPSDYRSLATLFLDIPENLLLSGLSLRQ